MNSQIEFDRLVSPQIPYLHAMAGRMFHTWPKEEREDLVQDTLIRAYEGLAGWNPEVSAIRTWLTKILKNRGIDLYRKKMRNPLEASCDVDKVPDAAVFSAGVAPTEAYKSIRQALYRMIENQRTVVVLRYVEGFDYQQISEFMGVPLGSVKSWLARARPFLTESVKKLAA